MQNTKGHATQGDGCAFLTSSHVLRVKTRGPLYFRPVEKVGQNGGKAKNFRRCRSRPYCRQNRTILEILHRRPYPDGKSIRRDGFRMGMLKIELNQDL